MTLISTLGSVDANSYVTQDEADNYFEDRMYSSSWEALEDENKEKFLITSSRMLDWYIKWKGNKTDSTQSMQWPRSNVIRPDGTEIDADSLPPEIKIATYEQALLCIASDRLLDDPLAGIGELKVSSLMIKAGPEKPNQTNKKPVPSHIYQILSDLYVQGTGCIVRLLRA